MTGTLLTTVEVAERLGLSSAAVVQAVRTGALQPSARTSDDLLFTERAVAAFAQRMAEVAASPLQPPAAGSRTEWSGEVDRVSHWLTELTEALAPPAAEVAFQAPAPAMLPVVEAQGIDFRRPPFSASAPARPALDPVPEPVAASPAAVEPAPTPQIAPAVADLEQDRPAPEEPVAEVPELDPVPPPLKPIAAAEAPVPLSVPDADPVPTTVPEVAAPPPGPGRDLSQQAVLVIQPIVRFRVLREVAGRLTTIPGIADARLEHLEAGVASYRIRFEGERPSDEAIAAALADVNLEVMLVDSFQG